MKLLRFFEAFENNNPQKIKLLWIIETFKLSLIHN
jgi:hypothetical protein